MRLLDAVGWAAVACAIAAATLIILPLEPDYLQPDIDIGFGATLHWAEVHRGEPGIRLIHTYGPLGFAHYSYFDPATFRTLIGVRLAFAAALCAPLAWLGWAATTSPWGAAVAVAAAAPLLGHADVRGVLLPLLVALAWLLRRPPPWMQLALGIGLALVALTKLTFLVLAGVAMLPALADLLARRRRTPWLIIAAVASGAALWLAWGLGARDLLAFLDWSLRDVMPGYARGEQMPTTPGLVLHAVAASLVVALGALAAARRAGGRRAVPLLVVAGLVFLIFKVGFVRADVHVFITAEVLLIAAVLLALAWGGGRPRRVVAAALLLGAVPATLFQHAAVVRGGWPAGPYRVVNGVELANRLRNLPALVDPAPFAATQSAWAAAVRAAQSLPAIAGAVDVYTVLQGRVLAHDLAFRPRPIFQSQLAYTPRLARENAAFLEGEWAPQWVFFQPAALDHGFPSLQDALSWPVLLTHYEYVSRHGVMILLGRRAAPRAWSIVPLATVRTTTDASVEVPDDGLVWARIDVREELADRLAGALLSIPTAWLRVRFVDGHTARYRLIPPLAREGFLLSPVVDRAEALADIMTGVGAPDARRIRRIAVEMLSPVGGRWPSRTVTVRFGQLAIAAAAPGDAPPLAPPSGSP